MRMATAPTAIPMMTLSHHLLVFRIRKKDKTAPTAQISPPIAPLTIGNISIAAGMFPQIMSKTNGSSASTYSYHFAGADT